MSCNGIKALLCSRSFTQFFKVCSQKYTKTRNWWVNDTSGISLLWFQRVLTNDANTTTICNLILYPLSYIFLDVYPMRNDQYWCLLHGLLTYKSLLNTCLKHCGWTDIWTLSQAKSEHHVSSISYYCIRSLPLRRIWVLRLMKFPCCNKTHYM